jgi:hypothetical protein
MQKNPAEWHLSFCGILVCSESVIQSRCCSLRRLLHRH